VSAFTNVWAEHATALVRKHGYTEALRLAIASRDENTMGTASHAFHSAVVKMLRLFATVGPIDAQ
jgi:hypothetical protein